MNKTSTIWIIAALCVAIVLTAFGVITNGVIQKDVLHSQQIVDAHREGRIRLALWRLDTLAASIVANEDERSVYEFKNPELSPSLNSVPSQEVNPFYFKTPATANLYWNIELQGQHSINSPQVYGKDYLIGNEIALDNNTDNIDRLNQLKEILSSKVTDQDITNRALSCTAAHGSLNNWSTQQENQNQVTDQQDFSYNNYAQNNQIQGKVGESLNAPVEQYKLTLADKGSRQKAVTRISSAKRASEWSKVIENSQNENPQIAKKQLKTTPPTQEQTPQLIKQDTSNTVEPFSTPFTPIWLNEELMLVRKADENNYDTVQGIWLNKSVLITKLLAEIDDLFPHAQLVPAKQDLTQILKGEKTKGDETTMLSLPLRLIHNDLGLVKPQATDYVTGPIGLAWLGAILAIIACYFTLKSVLKMSERRAAFVSSVTHELRTPLTTFRLYSDLLSSGMVTDKEKQKTYLNTLKHESERLTHLVENVLSYSQIEKGSAKAKVETISLYEFIQRIEPRLNERAMEDNMFVNTVFSDNSSDAQLRIDITAVDQIIFNLVDNACKYASGESHGKEITLLADITNKKINIQICDQGDGIKPSEQKRLFKPFHKSAKEAAHTKPGVGLGLALCKRLAKAMRGDLTITRKSKSKGASFLLTLPR